MRSFRSPGPGRLSAVTFLSLLLAAPAFGTKPSPSPPTASRASAAPRIWTSPRPLPGSHAPKPARAVCARGDQFEIVATSGSRPVFFRGINLGAAPPGHFPGEFAITKEDYARWLRFAHGLHANAIRVYALHPPAFYEALQALNREFPNSPIWLFQEVWTELPDSNDFWNRAFTRGFEDEIRLAIDALHGNAVVAERPGHAAGAYDVDVSPWVAGWLLGREWEPFAVRETERLHPDSTRFRGSYFAVDRGTPMEVWLATVCELSASYEATRYGVAHAVSFVNWPTLDPMRHPTETEAGGAEAEHDEDAYSVDPTRIRAIHRVDRESGFLGYFANYHVYPYYPDFMNLDPDYARFRDAHGACSYAGYLTDLKAHTRGIPLMIGEYGVPSSRGIAHQQPQGINHGGASEMEQGERDVRLFEDIAETGCAGSLLFALFDEWFKVNWLVQRIEQPRERDPIWHNLLDAEENYGLIAFDPRPAIRIDGKTNDWAGIAPYAKTTDPKSPLDALYVTSDQNQLYLRIDLCPVPLAAQDGTRRPPTRGPEPFRTPPPAPAGLVKAIGVSIDVLDPARGDRRLPAPIRALWSRGAEFVVVIEPPAHGNRAAAVFDQAHSSSGRAEIFIDRAMNYSTYSVLPAAHGMEWNTAPFRPVANADGRYTPLLIETNRERVSRTGTLYPAKYLDWGRLARGRGVSMPAPGGASPDSGAAYDPHNDWAIGDDGRSIEIAIPWGLLNVGDPSSLSVIDDKAGTKTVEVSKTRGIGLLAWATTADGFEADSLGPSKAGASKTRLAENFFLGPKGTSQVVNGNEVTVTTPEDASYLWNAWDKPITRERIKRSAMQVEEAFEGMESHEEHPQSEGKPGTH